MGYGDPLEKARRESEESFKAFWIKQYVRLWHYSSFIFITIACWESLHTPAGLMLAIAWIMYIFTGHIKERKKW